MITDEMVNEARDAYPVLGMRGALEAADRAAWKPIETAPTDGTLVFVSAAPYHDLDGFVTVARYYPDAGWCVDELREVTRWRHIPDAP